MKRKEKKTTLLLRHLAILCVLLLISACASDITQQQEATPKAYITSYRLVVSEELDHLTPLISEIWDSIATDVPSISLELLRYSDQIAGRLFLSGELRANGWLNYSQTWSDAVVENTKPLTERFKNCTAILEDSIDIGFRSTEKSSTLHALTNQQAESVFSALLENRTLRKSIRFILPNPQIESIGIEAFQLLDRAFKENVTLQTSLLSRISQLSPSSRGALALAENTSENEIPIVVTSSQKITENPSMKGIGLAAYDEGAIYASLCLSDSPWTNATQRAVSSRLRKALMREDTQSAFTALGYQIPKNSEERAHTPRQDEVASPNPWLKRLRLISPLELTIVSDLSGNIGNYQLYLQKAILRQLLVTKPWQTQITVIAVDGLDEVRIRHDKQNANDSSQFIENIHRSGATNLRDTISYAITHIEESATRNPNHRQALLVVSDGTDTSSKTSQAQLHEAIRKMQSETGLLSVFAILPQEGGEQSTHVHTMLELARISNGESISISKESLPLHVERLQRVLR